MTELIIFDIAGTILKDEGEVHHALKETLSRNGYEISRSDTLGVMGYPKPEAIKILLEPFFRPKKPDPELVRKMHDQLVDHMVLYYSTSDAVREKDDASRLFILLRKNGIKVALDTGFSRPVADTIIRRLGWGDKVDFTVTSDEVENGRPAPDMIFKCMQHFGLKNTKSVAKVGDTRSDLDQGTAAGCGLVAGVTTGNYSREQLETAPHTHLIDHLNELISILKLEPIENIHSKPEKHSND